MPTPEPRYAPPPTKAHGQEHQLILDGSPLALIGLFIEVLRERFAPDNGMPKYTWYEDVHKTSIIIESAFENGDIKRGDKPAIYIDRDEVVYGKSVIGDRAGYTFKDSKDFQWCLGTTPIIIDCVAARRGESAIIGDLVHWSLHVMSDAIQAAFALHDMSPPRLGRTIPYEDDKTAWSSPVSFTIQHNVRWTTVPVAPLLQEIVSRITASGLDPTQYMLTVTHRNNALPESSND
jgi:hypothetical protein